MDLEELLAGLTRYPGPHPTTYTPAAMAGVVAALAKRFGNAKFYQPGGGPANYAGRQPGDALLVVGGEDGTTFADFVFAPVPGGFAPVAVGWPGRSVGMAWRPNWAGAAAIVAAATRCGWANPLT